MVNLEESTTLADVVNASPELARELERRGLDYCCGGRRTLGEACTSVGLDPAATIAELAQAATPAPPPAWTTMPPEVLVDHLEAVHHRYLWDEMPRLTALLDKIVTVHGERHPELAEVAACFGEIRADLEPHMLKEERVLFPMVRELATSAGVPSFHCGSLRNPISVMLAEHDAVGDLLAKMRRLTNDYALPGDACASYAACYAGLEQLEADTHLHVHKENNLLFPEVVRLEAERAASPA
jgi:regulator of cell morphogenesis and NO signaling